ncbi:MAG: hypothetical protein QOK13_1131 [Gaiellaceae bacterium]|nr:hypothetical protein [Gaiellaceae bacterium]MDX6542990.1 hypothetical protein [Gaiellaceae bacterium]
MGGSELTRELLELFRKRAAELEPVDLLRQYERDRFVRPAPPDPNRRNEVERLAFSLLPDGFERIELSPLAPLGTTAVLGGLSQDWAVATARGTEVVSDVTNVLTLEAASRRRRSREEVSLAATARVTRPQAPTRAEQLAHFGLLGLVSAGRGERWSDWELRKATEHVRFYRELLQALGAEDVELRVGGGLELEVAATHDPQERPYYAGGWFSIDVGGGNVADGGFVDWTRKLLSDRKERCLISGAGIERLASLTT